MQESRSLDVQQARRGLLLFFLIVVPASALIEVRLILAGDSIRNHVALVLLLMWSPAIASVIARLALREGLTDVSFRFGGSTGARMALAALLFPLLVGSLAYGLAWWIGLADFELAEVPGLPNISKPWLAFLLLVVIRSSIGVVIAGIAAAGEEIGWRGYMLTRLIKAGVPKAILVSSIIWWAWHAPMIVAGVYAAGSNHLASAGLFLLTIGALGFFLARVRLESGSIWPAIIGHSAWNAIIQGVFDFSTADESAGLWVGESGLLVAITSVIVTWFFVRKPRPNLSAPGQPLTTN
jgi:membrane protease YdiL (CAAX protease family)